MSLYEIPVTTLDGESQTLAPYRGRVLLVVNVASQCGFTGQYAGLEDLNKKYRGKGLAVLGFPCNQFGRQEPGEASAIGATCSRFSATFPMFAKIEVNGPGTHPLYAHLKAARAGTLGTRSIKWNFTKFLVARNGDVVARYGSLTKPRSLDGRIADLLGA